MKNFNPVGVSPGATIGDMIKVSRQTQRPMRPVMPKRRMMQPDAIRTTVDYGMAPKMGRKR